MIPIPPPPELGLLVYSSSLSFFNNLSSNLFYISIWISRVRSYHYLHSDWCPRLCYYHDVLVIVPSAFLQMSFVRNNFQVILKWSLYLIYVGGFSFCCPNLGRSCSFFSTVQLLTLFPLRIELAINMLPNFKLLQGYPDWHTSEKSWCMQQTNNKDEDIVLYCHFATKNKKKLVCQDC